MPPLLHFSEVAVRIPAIIVRTGSGGGCNFTLPPDSFVSEPYYSDPSFSLGWYRRNEQSVFRSTMTDQRLGELARTMPDPLMNRTSGAIVIANSEGSAAFLRQNATHAVSPKAAERHTVSVYTHTMLAEDQANAFDFLKQTMLRAKDDWPITGASPAGALENHTEWWGTFWQRSWVSMKAHDPASGEAAAARALSEAYTLNRCEPRAPPFPAVCFPERACVRRFDGDSVSRAAADAPQRRDSDVGLERNLTPRPRLPELGWRLLVP